MSRSSTTEKEYSRAEKLDQELAPVMWSAAIVFLVFTAALLHLTDGDVSTRMAQSILRTMGIVYVAFPVEIFLQWMAGGKLRRQHWLVLLLPPLRLATWDHSRQDSVWLPGWGWNSVSKDFERRLHDWFSIPMMCLAVLVLPLIITEFFWAEVISDSETLTLSFNSAMALIWTAFAYEFVTMFSVTSNRKRYLLKNWIDIVVILLPLVAFMRGARLVRLLRLNQVSKSARLYRVRGVLLRTWRAMVAMDILERLLFRDPQQRLSRMEERILEHEHELDMLRKKAEGLKARLPSQTSQQKAEFVELSPTTSTVTLTEPNADVEATLEQLVQVSRKAHYRPVVLDKEYLNRGFLTRDNASNG